MNPTVELKSVNELDPESILRYIEYVLGKRYQEELSGADYHMGVKGSTDPLMAAHYALNNAALCMIGDLAKQIGIDIYAFSRGKPGQPDTRTFLSVYEDKGIVFKDRSYRDTPLPASDAKINAAYRVANDERSRMHDVVDKLMHKETPIEKRVASAKTAIVGIEAAIKAIKAINGDVSQYEAQLKTQKDALTRAEEELETVQTELEHSREYMKHIDSAHEGLHWGSLSRSRLNNFLREKKNVG